MGPETVDLILVPHGLADLRAAISAVALAKAEVPAQPSLWRSLNRRLSILNLQPACFHSLAHSFCALLHTVNCHLSCFHAVTHSFTKTPGGGGIAVAFRLLPGTM